MGEIKMSAKMSERCGTSLMVDNQLYVLNAVLEDGSAIYKTKDINDYPYNLLYTNKKW